MILSLVLCYWIVQVVGSISLPWKVLKTKQYKANKETNKEKPTNRKEKEISANSDDPFSCHSSKPRTLRVTQKCMLRSESGLENGKQRFVCYF